MIEQLLKEQVFNLISSDTIIVGCFITGLTCFVQSHKSLALVKASFINWWSHNGTGRNGTDTITALQSSTKDVSAEISALTATTNRLIAEMQRIIFEATGDGWRLYHYSEEAFDNLLDALRFQLRQIDLCMNHLHAMINLLENATATVNFFKILPLYISVPINLGQQLHSHLGDTIGQMVSVVLIGGAKFAYWYKHKASIIMSGSGEPEPAPEVISGIPGVDTESLRLIVDSLPMFLTVFLVILVIMLVLHMFTTYRLNILNEELMLLKKARLLKKKQKKRKKSTTIGV